MLVNRLFWIPIVIASLLGSPASAQTVAENVLLCDTAEQVVKFVTQADETGDIEQSLKTVNAEAGKEHACTIEALVVYRTGDVVAEVRYKTKTLQVREIDVLQIGPFRAPSTKQFSTFEKPVVGQEV